MKACQNDKKEKKKERNWKKQEASKQVSKPAGK